MRRPPSGLLILVAAATALVLVAGCGSGSRSASAPGEGASSSPPTLRVGTVANLALSVPLVGLADDAARVGYASAVEFVPANSPDEIRANLTSGQVDLATMPTTIAAGLANGGIGVQLVGVVDADLLKVIGPAGGSGWEALRGQTVHVPFRGDLADLVFAGLTEERGLIAGRDIALAYGTALPELVSGIATGRVRYAVLPEQFATVARRQADAGGRPMTELLSLPEEWRRATGAASLPGSAIVIRTEVAEQRPPLVEHLRRHFSATTTAVTADPDGAAAELGRLARVPAELIPAVLPDLQVRFLEPGQARPDIEILLRRLTEREPRVTGGRLPDAAFYGT